ncbi:MAG: hypothetical protein ACQETE_13865 [Bacteroidota bacterium]
MQIDRLRPTKYRITLHSYDMAALLSAARWVVEGAEGELSDEAKAHLAQVVANYDEAVQQVNEPAEAENY